MEVPGPVSLPLFSLSLWSPFSHLFPFSLFFFLVDFSFPFSLSAFPSFLVWVYTLMSLSVTQAHMLVEAGAVFLSALVTFQDDWGSGLKAGFLGEISHTVPFEKKDEDF